MRACLWMGPVSQRAKYVVKAIADLARRTRVMWLYIWVFTGSKITEKSCPIILTFYFEKPTFCDW